MQVYRSLRFLRFGLAVPTDPFWAESAAVVAKHPFGLYLEYLASPPEKAMWTLCVGLPSNRRRAPFDSPTENIALSAAWRRIVRPAAAAIAE